MVTCNTYFVQGKLDDYNFLAVFKSMNKIRFLRDINMCQLEKLKKNVCGDKASLTTFRKEEEEKIVVVVTSNFSVLHSLSLFILVMQLSSASRDLTRCTVFRN